MSEQQAIAIREPSPIKRQSPREAVAEAKEQADTLMDIVRAGKLAVDGKYLKAEAWQTIARFNGFLIMPAGPTTDLLDADFNYLGSRAQCQLVRISTGEILPGAEGTCMMDETVTDRETGEEKPRWEDRYACASMAQTRAQGKTGRMAFAWVAVLAGYDTTPAEEMDGIRKTGGAPDLGGDRLCPQCQKPAIIKGRAEYGGGWLCFKKKGGCGAKFPDGYDFSPKDKAGFPGHTVAPEVVESDIEMPADLEQTWIRLDEMREAKGWTKAKLTKHLMATFNTPDPRKLSKDQLFSVVQYLGSIPHER